MGRRDTRHGRPLDTAAQAGALSGQEFDFVEVFESLAVELLGDSTAAHRDAMVIYDGFVGSKDTGEQAALIYSLIYPASGMVRCARYDEGLAALASLAARGPDSVITQMLAHFSSTVKGESVHGFFPPRGLPSWFMTCRVLATVLEIALAVAKGQKINADALVQPVLRAVRDMAGAQLPGAASLVVRELLKTLSDIAGVVLGRASRLPAIVEELRQMVNDDVALGRMIEQLSHVRLDGVFDVALAGLQASKKRRPPDFMRAVCTLITQREATVAQLMPFYRFARKEKVMPLLAVLAGLIPDKAKKAGDDVVKYLMATPEPVLFGAAVRALPGDTPVRILAKMSVQKWPMEWVDPMADVLVALYRADEGRFTKLVMPGFASPLARDARTSAFVLAGARLSPSALDDRVRAFVGCLIGEIPAGTTMLPGHILELNKVVEAANELLEAFLQRNRWINIEIGKTVTTANVPLIGQEWKWACPILAALGSMVRAEEGVGFLAKVLELCVSPDHALAARAEATLQSLALQDAVMVRWLCDQCFQNRSKAHRAFSYVHVVRILQHFRAEGELAEYLDVWSFAALFMNGALVRGLALDALRLVGRVYGLLVSKTRQITDRVLVLLQIMAVPESPLEVLVPVSRIDFFAACKADSHSLWRLFAVELVNTLVEDESQRGFLKKLRDAVGPILVSGTGLDEPAIVLLDLLWMDTFASEPEDPALVAYVDTTLKSGSFTAKRCLVQAFGFVNQRVVPSLIPFFRFEANLVPVATVALSQILRVPENFATLGQRLVPSVLDFLRQVEVLFARSTTTASTKVAYCVLVSTSLSNMTRGDVEVDRMREVYRVVVKWIDADDRKLRNWAVNATIAVVTCCTIFDSDMPLDRDTLKRFIGWEREGFTVLENLLGAHDASLTPEFVGFWFTEPTGAVAQALETFIRRAKMRRDQWKSEIGPVLLFLGAIAQSNWARVQGLYQHLLGDEVTIEFSSPEVVRRVFDAEVEYVLEAGLKMLNEYFSSPLALALNWWMREVRFVASRNAIVPMVKREQVRRFTIYGFLEAVEKVVASTTERQGQVLGELLNGLLLDQATAVPVLAFFSGNEKALSALAMVNPRAVTEFVAGRLSFACSFAVPGADIGALMRTVAARPVRELPAHECAAVIARVLIHAESVPVFRGVLQDMLTDVPDANLLWAERNVAAGCVEDLCGRLEPAYVQALAVEAGRWMLGSPIAKVAARAAVVFAAVDGPSKCEISERHVLRVLKFHIGQSRDDPALLQLLSELLRLMVGKPSGLAVARVCVRLPLDEGAVVILMQILAEDVAGLVPLVAALLPGIEASPERQESLAAVMAHSPPPSVQVVHSLLSRAALPLIRADLARPWEELLPTLGLPAVGEALRLVARLLPGASAVLLGATLQIGITLVDSFGGRMNEADVHPLYLAARKHLGFVPAASEFLIRLVACAPRIASFCPVLATRSVQEELSELLQAVSASLAPLGEPRRVAISAFDDLADLEDVLGRTDVEVSPFSADASLLEKFKREASLATARDAGHARKQARFLHSRGSLIGITRVDDVEETAELSTAAQFTTEELEAPDLSLARADLLVSPAEFLLLMPMPDGAISVAA